jgi:hypothetical protein
MRCPESQEAMLKIKGNLFEVERCDADHSPFVGQSGRRRLFGRLLGRECDKFGTTESWDDRLDCRSLQSIIKG